MRERTIEQVQEAHMGQWMAIPGVEGTAIGLFEDEPCIKIFSTKKAESLRGLIPSSIDGYIGIIEATSPHEHLS